MKEMIGGCCVCSDERGWNENPLVYCDGIGCNVAVHKACYGIIKVPKGNWYCRKCESEDSASIKCELCPNRDGALKPINQKSRWAHVVCALYIPEVSFLDVSTMEPIDLQQVPQEKFKRICFICEEAGHKERATIGACMSCNRTGCRLHFHVTCAQALGLLCEEAGQFASNVTYCGYCPQHYHKRKGNNVKPIPAYHLANSELPTTFKEEITTKISKRKSSTSSKGSNKGTGDEASNSMDENNIESKIMYGSLQPPLYVNDRYHESKKKRRDKSSRKTSGSPSTSPKYSGSVRSSFPSGASISHTPILVQVPLDAAAISSTQPPILENSVVNTENVNNLSQDGTGGSINSGCLSGDPPPLSPSPLLIDKMLLDGVLIKKKESVDTFGETSVQIKAEEDSKMVNDGILPTTNIQLNEIKEENILNSVITKSPSKRQRTGSGDKKRRKSSSHSRSNSRKNIHLNESSVGSNNNNVNNLNIRHVNNERNKSHENNGEKSTLNSSSSSIDSSISSLSTNGVTADQQRTGIGVILRNNTMPSTMNTNKSPTPISFVNGGSHMLGNSLNPHSSMAEVFSQEAVLDPPESPANEDGEERGGSTLVFTTESNLGNQTFPIDSGYSAGDEGGGGTNQNNNGGNNGNTEYRQPVTGYNCVRSPDVQSGYGNGVRNPKGDNSRWAPHRSGSGNSNSNRHDFSGVLLRNAMPNLTGGSSVRSSSYWPTNGTTNNSPNNNERPNVGSDGPLSWLTNNWPTSFEELLTRQWEQGHQFLMEQAHYFDLASLMSCLYKLMQENNVLDDRIAYLTSARDTLLAVNARLSMPLPQQYQMEYPQTNNSNVGNNPHINSNSVDRARHMYQQQNVIVTSQHNNQNNRQNYGEMNGNATTGEQHQHMASVQNAPRNRSTYNTTHPSVRSNNTNSSIGPSNLLQHVHQTISNTLLSQPTSNANSGSSHYSTNHSNKHPVHRSSDGYHQSTGSVINHHPQQIHQPSGHHRTNSHIHMSNTAMNKNDNWPNIYNSTSMSNHHSRREPSATVSVTVSPGLVQLANAVTSATPQTASVLVRAAANPQANPLTSQTSNLEGASTQSAPTSASGLPKVVVRMDELSQFNNNSSSTSSGSKPLS